MISYMLNFLYVKYRKQLLQGNTQYLNDPLWRGKQNKQFAGDLVGWYGTGAQIGWGGMSIFEP